MPAVVSKARDLKRRLVLTGLFTAVVAAGVVKVRRLAEPNLPLSDLPLHPELQNGLTPHLKHGDILFRGRDNSWGELGAMASREDQRYGHVGVVSRQEDDWAVISATGNPLESQGGVIREPLEKFIGFSTRLGLYRLAIEEDGFAAFLRGIEAHLAQRTQFDRLYDISENEAVYCTELIWLSLNDALGRDVISDKTKWRGRLVIALDDLQRLSFMQEVIHLDQVKLKTSDSV